LKAIIFAVALLLQYLERLDS